jgi:ankyrin repeat protein
VWTLPLFSHEKELDEELARLLVQEWTALHFAAKWGFLDIAQALLEAGADITAKHMVSCQSPVLTCATLTGL